MGVDIGLNKVLDRTELDKTKEKTCQLSQLSTHEQLQQHTNTSCIVTMGSFFPGKKFTYFLIQ